MVSYSHGLSLLFSTADKTHRSAPICLPDLTSHHFSLLCSLLEWTNDLLASGPLHLPVYLFIMSSPQVSLFLLVLFWNITSSEILFLITLYKTEPLKLFILPCFIKFYSGWVHFTDNSWDLGSKTTKVTHPEFDFSIDEKNKQTKNLPSPHVLPDSECILIIACLSSLSLLCLILTLGFKEQGVPVSLRMR